MKLRGIDFGPVWDASGVRGFFGEGYWYHRWIPGLSFEGSTFVAKTTTMAPRPGNMELAEDGITPKRGRPDCIVVKPLRGAVMNAVGLSGPGARSLFADGRWQRQEKPFFLSFMSVGPTLFDRLKELDDFVDTFEIYRESLRRVPVGLQINLSCPNTGHDFSKIEEEAGLMIDSAGQLGIPLVAKFNAVTPVALVARIAEHPACDAVCVSNTIPWKEVDPDVRNTFCGSTESPLAKYGGGGLSGAPIFPLVLDWVKRAVEAGFPKPINAGGGILGPKDVEALRDAGASSVFLGSIAILRGWRVRKTIRAAHACFGKGA